MIVRKVIVTGGLFALLWWLERRGRAADNDGQVIASSFVQKNGACYKVTFYADGRSSSSPAPAASCAADAGPGDLSDPVDDPDLGFNRLIHLFDNL